SQPLATAAAASSLTYEQQEALKTYFATNSKIAAFGAEPAKLLSNPKLTGFFEKYGSTLLVINVANQLANTNDLEAAKLLAGQLGTSLLTKIAPTFAGVLNWFGWAKTGMELFKAGVFDPKLEQMHIAAYNHLREIFGHDPNAAADAFATMHDIGKILD